MSPSMDLSVLASHRGLMWDEAAALHHECGGCTQRRDVSDSSPSRQRRCRRGAPGQRSADHSQRPCARGHRLTRLGARRCCHPLVRTFATRSRDAGNGDGSIPKRLIQTFLSTLIRRQVVEKWCRYGGSIESISVVRDSLREEQQLQSLLVIERGLHPQV